MNKRNLFIELSRGLKEARKHDQGKLSLRSTPVEFKPLDATPNEAIRTSNSKQI